MKYISTCNVIIYDLHSGNPEDIKLALEGRFHLLINFIALKKYTLEQETVLILISSVMVWNKTEPKMEEVKKDAPEGEEKAEGDEGEEGDKEDEPAEDENRSEKEEADKEAEEGEEGDEKEVKKEEVVEVPKEVLL
jgi:adenylate kinase